MSTKKVKAVTDKQVANMYGIGYDGEVGEGTLTAKDMAKAMTEAVKSGTNHYAIGKKQRAAGHTTRIVKDANATEKNVRGSSSPAKKSMAQLTITAQAGMDKLDKKHAVALCLKTLKGYGIEVD